MPKLETEVELLKQELHDQRKIHDRLDIAIEKLTDVSNSIHRMLAVHDEKITRQEDAIVAAEESIETRRIELSEKIAFIILTLLLEFHTAKPLPSPQDE